MTGYLIWVYEKSGQSFLNKHNIPKVFELTNKTILKGISNQTTKLFSGVDETTSKWISDQIVDGVKNNRGREDIVSAILDKMTTYPQYRADTIVRTESAIMVGNAEHTTAVKNGASNKTWQTAGDSRVSDECWMNEQAGMIGIDATFPAGAMVPPQHPNCRCVVDYHFTPFMGAIWGGQ